MIICTSTGSFTAVKLFLPCEIKSKSGKSDDLLGFQMITEGSNGTKVTLYMGKKVFLVVSIHFQVNLKVTQNLKKIGEMVLAHHGKMVFT